MKSASSYAVLIKRSAEKEVNRLPAKTFDRIASALAALSHEPRPRGCRKLRGSEQYRLRVGDYRVLYLISDEKRTVEIVAVGHRRDVYG
jgi:mRNA interferase RelE/StbE